MYQSIYSLICMAYSTILRDLLKEAIDDPKKEWDEWTLDLLDKMFNYQEK